MIRAIERAVDGQELTGQPDSDEIAQLVKRALETDAAEQAWREFLDSEQAQLLVERIAGALRSELRSPPRAPV